MSTDTDYWLRYRKADLVAQIAAEEALGRNTGLLHAAKRMVAHLEGREADMHPDTVPEALKHCVRCGRSSLAAVIDPRNGVCTRCITITADKENTLGKKKDDLRDLRADHDLLRDFVHRQNVEANKRLDTLEDKVADLTGRMGAREDAAHNLVEALDDVNQNLDTTDGCVAVLKDTVAKLADCVENLNRAQESTTSTLKTQHHLIQRLKNRLDQQHDEMVMIDQVNKNHVDLIERLLDRVAALEDREPMIGPLRDEVAKLNKRLGLVEDRLDPPSHDESLQYRIVQQDDDKAAESNESQEKSKFDFHKYWYDPRPANEVYPEPHETANPSLQERLDNIGRWMHPGLWSTFDGRREAILKILGGQHVEPPLAGGGRGE